MNSEISKNDNIFEAVQESYKIREVAQDLGIKLHKVGSGFRADSIADNGDGENAFAIYEKTNTWYDFMLKIGGDITDLVAHVKYDGDKSQALHELMPQWRSEKIKQQISQKEQFLKEFNERCERFLKRDNPIAQRAFDYLHSRGITDETIKELKINVEYNGGKRICFPYLWKDGKTITYYTTRRFDWTGNGENENEPKYKKASLEAFPFFKNSILGLNTLNRNKDELIITEGMFDWIHCYQQGYSVISPNGTDFGKLWPEVIEIIKNHFKKVILAFDSDEAGQLATYKTAEVLLKEKIPFDVSPLSLCKDVAEFCEKGGKVQALINSAREGRKWFIDYLTPKRNFNDLTIAEREKAMQKVKDFIKTIAPYTDSADIHEILINMRMYFPKEWVSALFTKARKGLKEDEVKDIVNEEHKLLYNEKTGFYEYSDKGIWEERDDTTIQGYIMKSYGVNATGGKLTSTLRLVKADERINSMIPITEFNRQACIAFINGTLHINTKTGKTKFLPHREYDYVTVRVPYYYDPNVKCVNWEKFLKEVTNGNLSRQKLLQEFAGYALLPDCKYHKALMLKGGGSNGKSVFTNIISAVLGGIGNGRGYISAAEPSKFSKDFRLMPFKNSWLNISSDAESDLRGAEGVFKKIVAGEVLEDSYKHKDPIPFQTRTKLMMCCNNFPLVNDTSEGFMRRWLIVEFPMHYVQASDVKQNTNDRPIDPNLEEKLMQELPGIFNWMLEGLQQLIKQNGFTETSEQKELLREFIKTNNPLVTFAEDAQELFYEDEGYQLKGKRLQRREIFKEYKVWAENNASFPIPANRFYSALKTVLTWMGIEVEINGMFWTFKDINVDWEDDYYDDEDDDNEENTNPEGYIVDPEEEMTAMGEC